MHAYSGAVKSVSRFKPKAKLWYEGRRDIFDRLRTAIPKGERIVWIHAASLGEFEQGQPLIAAIREQHPEYKILLTFFSPSGYEIRKNYSGVDYVFYMPMDTPKNARRFLEIVNPEIAIFIKYEFWLNYLTELRKRGCRTFIVSAIFRRDSIFFRIYGKDFRKALRGYEHLFVQNEESRKLLESIGVTNVTVAGDTRFDRVAAIAAAAKDLPTIADFSKNSDVFIAGSTWGPDEEILQGLINDNRDMKFIVAPHEMEISRIASLMAHTEGGAARYTECGETEICSSKHLLIIDTIGILSSVYQYAGYAYIGGGFGVGIHNTLEAATFGLPIAFGPNYEKFREARELIEIGAARSVKSAEELAQWLGELRSDPAKYQAARKASADYVESHKGATATILKGIFG